MEKTKQIVIKEQEVYTITEEELNKIKSSAMNDGRTQVVNYIGFALKNYDLELNISGMCKFIEELVQFVTRKSDIISNTHGYSFFDYLKFMSNL